MRNPERIDPFCKNLAELWHRVPDWRFGQLMINLLSFYMNETGRDAFFVEDAEFMDRMRSYMDEILAQ